MNIKSTMTIESMKIDEDVNSTSNSSLLSTLLVFVVCSLRIPPSVGGIHP